MRKQVYISADYSRDSGDRNVVDLLNSWGNDSYHAVNFVDMAKVVSGSVSNDEDCRACDLKYEFNRQINASSFVIIVIGDKTANRTAGSSCARNTKSQFECPCTPYKQNANGSTYCKVSMTFPSSSDGDIGNINGYSYLRHEFEQAKRKNKMIIVLYNSTRKEVNWLPPYMKDYENVAQPFWKIDDYGHRVGNYQLVKKALGYE